MADSLYANYICFFLSFIFFILNLRQLQRKRLLLEQIMSLANLKQKERKKKQFHYITFDYLSECNRRHLISFR